MTTRQKAREICAKLIPHTTSVHNVDVVAKALDDARREALDDAASIAAEHYEAGFAENRIRALMEKEG